MNDVYVIGVTGGIGAGKSFVLDFLREKYGACILMADLIARRLMERGGSLYDKILSEFGSDLGMEDGSLDRDLLAKRLFEQGADLNKINDIVHPAVVEEISRIIEEQRNINAQSSSLRLIVVEAALLFEGHADVLCDEVWYVYADKQTRIARLMENRGYSMQKCISIMDRQQSDEAFKRRCQVIIDNSREILFAIRQIDEQIKRIMKTDRKR